MVVCAKSEGIDLCLTCRLNGSSSDAEIRILMVAVLGEKEGELGTRRDAVFMSVICLPN